MVVKRRPRTAAANLVTHERGCTVLAPASLPHSLQILAVFPPQRCQIFVVFLYCKHPDFCIYAGNGRNDFKAIDYIRKNSKGYSICPENSRRTVKSIVNFTSTNPDIEGVIDGLNNLNNLLIQKNRNEDRDER